MTSFLWRTDSSKLLTNFGFPQKERIDHIDALQTPLSENITGSIFYAFVRPIHTFKSVIDIFDDYHDLQVEFD